MKTGFDNGLYMELQAKHIIERIGKFDNKLYLEFGGKLFDDFHAARVLPGFDVNGKVRLLQKLRDSAELIICIKAADIEQNRIRADIGITYDMDVLRLIDNLRALGLTINSIVITQYAGQPAADIFRKRLDIRGEKSYVHTCTKGYPTDVNIIVSDEGYGANEFIETTRPLVVVTAPGPGSGKLATCLSQLYHEFKRGNKAGYAKFETFPIWNLPLAHPVNLAYEAATADLKDVNMIDPFHLEAYRETTVNYNRDIEVFPVVRTILEKITGKPDVYKSPTDMGVNMAGKCITDDAAVCEAARQEIIRRYFKTCCDSKFGRVGNDVIQRIEMIMGRLDIKPENRAVVAPALEKSLACGAAAAAVELPDGSVVTGKASALMTAPSAAVLNALKCLAGINETMLLISPNVLEPIQALKEKSLGYKNHVLNLEEILIALSISASINPAAEQALKMLGTLQDCEAHATYILAETDQRILRRLGVNLTCEAEFPSKDLYYE